jgi:hypothetical protein
LGKSQVGGHGPSHVMRGASLSDATNGATVWSLILYTPESRNGTGGKRAYGPGSFGPLVPVAEPGSITRDQCRSWFQHESGPIGLHVDALRREGAWVIGPGS